MHRFQDGPAPDGYAAPRLLRSDVRARAVDLAAARAAALPLENGSGLVSRVLRRRQHAALTRDEAHVLERAVAEVWDVEPRETLIRAGTPLDVSTLLISGWMARYVDHREGGRQAVAVHLGGDFVDLHAYPLKVLDHSLETLTAVRIGLVPHARLHRIQAELPELARKLWFMTLLDGALLRRSVFRLGRLSAAERLADLLCELHLRMNAVGLAEADRFLMPLTQSDLAALCGISHIHVNRVLRELRERGLVTLKPPWVVFPDPARLAEFGHFQSDYLYLDDDSVVATANRWRQGG